MNWIHIQCQVVPLYKYKLWKNFAINKGKTIWKKLISFSSPFDTLFIYLLLGSLFDCDTKNTHAHRVTVIFRKKNVRFDGILSI